MPPVLPADNHVHSQWSYDTFGRVSMVDECQRALDLGVSAVAFTEHLDFTNYGPGDAIATSGIKPGWWDATRPLAGHRRPQRRDGGEHGPARWPVRWVRPQPSAARGHRRADTRKERM